MSYFGFEQSDNIAKEHAIRLSGNRLSKDCYDSHHWEDPRKDGMEIENQYLNSF